MNIQDSEMLEILTKRIQQRSRFKYYELLREFTIEDDGEYGDSTTHDDSLNVVVFVGHRALRVRRVRTKRAECRAISSAEPLPTPSS